MPTFKIVNPKIIGGFNDTIEAPNNIEAANEAWVKMSEHITNNVPKFAFTMKDTKSGKLHNFSVKENQEGKLANYEISELDHEISSSQKRALENEENLLDKKTKNIAGGRRKHRYHNTKELYGDDSSSSSTSEEDEYEKIRLLKKYNTPQPIVYWWYTPYLYQDYYSSMFIPTFNAPLVPYVEISLSSAFLR